MEGQETFGAVEPLKPKLSRHDKLKAIAPDKPLTRKEQAFVAEYLIDMNGSAAMRRLGRKNSVDKRANEMLARGNVRKAVDTVLAAREKAVEISIDKLEKRWADYAFCALDKIAGPIQHSHVLTALEHLGKLKGAYKPETQTVIPVVFQFLGAPALPTDANLTIEARVQAETPSSPSTPAIELLQPSKR